jgi:hypothetical protein
MYYISESKVYDRMMTIKKGTECHPSVRGHYNFFYPDFSKIYKLAMNVEVNALTWKGIDQYRAYEVISPENYLPVKVLWIKE